MILWIIRDALVKNNFKKPSRSFEILRDGHISLLDLSLDILDTQNIEFVCFGVIIPTVSTLFPQFGCFHRTRRLPTRPADHLSQPAAFASSTCNS